MFVPKRSEMSDMSQGQSISRLQGSKQVSRLIYSVIERLSFTAVVEIVAPKLSKSSKNKAIPISSMVVR